MENFIDSFEVDGNDKPVVKGWRLTLGYAGFFMIVVGIMLLVPLITLIFYPSEAKYFIHFLIVGLLNIIIGCIPFFRYIYKRKHAQLATHQDACIVVLCWILAIVMCAIPFATSGLLTFSQAIFESASGITTCGLSIVSDFDNFPHIFFILRSLTHLVGGIGLVLVMISALSDRYGMKLYASEGHYDRFMPNLLKSSRAILLIYLGFIISGVIAYVICGMPVFDAIVHSIAAVATGGFSNRADSIGFYNSRSIEIVSMVLMLFGSTNFLAHVFLFKGKFKNFFMYCENKFMYAFYAVVIPLAAIGLFCAYDKYSIGDSFLISAFHVISALSTTGFQTVKISPSTASSFLFILTLCMLIGGQTNSTAGGLKIYRLNLMIKSIYIKMKDSLMKTKTVHYYRVYQLDEETYITNETLQENNLFLVTWIAIYFISVLVYCFAGIPFVESIFEVASILGTVGMSMGGITANSPAFIFYFSALIMLIGRLEVFVVFYGIIYSIRTPISKILTFKSRRKE